MPHSHIHQDADPLFRPTACESVTRNAHGQTLDDAREAFRAEWQSQIDRKRQQASEARKLGVVITRASKVLTDVSAILGAVAGGAQCEKSLGLPGLLLGAFGGAVAGYTVAFLALAVAAIARRACLLYAERLEREAQDLERS